MTDEVDIIAGTFSKSLASIGGFVAASESVIHYLKHHSRPLIFTASLPPANTAGVLAALAGAAGRARAPRPPVGQHPPAPGGLPQPRLRHRPHRDADRAGAHRPAGEDLPHVAAAVRRRRVHQPGRAAGGAAVPVPAAHQPHGDAHLRADRLRSGAVRPHRHGTWGSSDRSRCASARRATDGTSSASSICPTDSTRGTRSGSRRCVGTWRLLLDRTQESLLRARRGRVLPGRAGRRRSSAASPPSATGSTTRPTTTGSASSASSSASTTRPWRTRCFAAAAEWCRAQGPRRPARPRLVLGQRRVRAAGGRLRVPARAHDAAQPALLRARWSSAPDSPRRRTSGSTRAAARSDYVPVPERLARGTELIRQRLGITHSPARPRRTSTARSSGSRRSTTRPGRRTGASCP